MSENEVILPGVNSANTKLHKVRAFLSKPPKRAATLVMFALDSAEGTQLQLHEWERAEVLPELAPGILARLDEHGAEIEASVVSAVLTYLDADSKALGSMQLRKQRKLITDEASFVAAQLGGDAQSLVVQAQANNFNMTRLYMGGMAQVLATSERLSQASEERWHAEVKRNARLEVELEQLRAALAAAEACIAQGIPDGASEASPAQAEALGILKQLAPMLLARLMEPASPPARPQA